MQQQPLQVVVVGGGAAGWLAAHQLRAHPDVGHVTLVSSDRIPPIGVGESTTLAFFEYLYHVLGLRGPAALEFLVDVDAALKYGMYYQGWSPRDFLHAFFSPRQSSMENLWRLGNKPPERGADDYIAPAARFVRNNQVDTRLAQPHAFHFDANRLIHALAGLARAGTGISEVSGTVVATRRQGEQISAVELDDGRILQADYFVSCIGERAFNEKVFGEAYQSYGAVLLTRRAVVYPLPYTNKRNQFHPYTMARTMRHGWRWITPTWSRIGTGYVFSTAHVSEDEAVAEFLADIGDPTLKPFVVDFAPRRVERAHKANWTTLGMAAGFLEPLDAPGLTLTLSGLDRLSELLPILRRQGVASPAYDQAMEAANTAARVEFDTWCSFILCQYKTCHRDDTPFWRDHKAVRFEFHEELMQKLFNPGNRVEDLVAITHEPNMFLATVAGKDIPWQLDDPTPPRALDSTLVVTAHHLDVLTDIHRRVQASRSSGRNRSRVTAR